MMILIFLVLGVITIALLGLIGLFVGTFINVANPYDMIYRWVSEKKVNKKLNSPTKLYPRLNKCPYSGQDYP